MKNQEIVDIQLSKNYSLRIIKFLKDNIIELGTYERIYSPEIGYRVKLSMKKQTARELGKALLKLTEKGESKK